MAPWIAAFFFEEYHHINFAFTDIPSIECVAAIQELFVYVLENEDSRKRQEEIFFQAVLNRRGTGVAFAPLVSFVFQRLEKFPEEAQGFVEFLVHKDWTAANQKFLDVWNDAPARVVLSSTEPKIIDEPTVQELGFIFSKLRETRF